MLGVELNERFKITYNDGEGYSSSCYWFQEDGLRVEGFDTICLHIELGKLLNNVYHVKKIPWVPQEGEKYYLPDICDLRVDFESSEYDPDDDFDIHIIHNRLHCKTKKDAAEKTDIILQLWNDYCEKNNL